MPTSSLRKNCLWLDELGPVGDARRLERPVSADVCIVGGGYLGLWTAIKLRQAAPDVSVVVLERGLCGEGASGRNGGFILTWWAKVQALLAIAGREEAIRLALASQAAVEEIGSFCASEGIDAGYRRDGWIWAATAPAQVDAWRQTVRTVGELGHRPFEVLDPEEVGRRAGSRSLAGVFEPGAAVVQPARLARGLRDVARRLGAEVYENSAVEELRDREGKVRTALASVSAGTVVVANNAWATRIGELSRGIIAVSSDIVATEPAPEVLEEIGWTGGEAISNSRLMVDYYRTTGDGRIVFGRAGGVLARGGRIGPDFDLNPAGCDLAAASMRRIFPETARLAITHRWSGPVDRTVDGLPFFGSLESARQTLYGVGFSGNGVGPTLIGAKILTSAVLGRDDEWTRSVLNQGMRGKFPPEPIRYLGGRLVKGAVARKEALEDEGRSASRPLAALAALAPSGFSESEASGRKP